MEFSWIQEGEALFDLVRRSEQADQRIYSLRKLLGLVRFVCPEALVGETLDEWSLIFSREPHKFVQLFIDIPEEDRVEIYERCVSDLQPYYPHTTASMLSHLAIYLEEREAQKEGSLDKLNRYLRRIDGAILAGRYSLALQLTNRCLMEYYRQFMKQHMPFEPLHYDLNIMSLSVVRYMGRYFRKYRIPYKEQSLLLMTTVTNVLATTVRSLNRKNSSLMIDKAIAVYARNNVQRIVRFLSKYL
jgi:hypothetical protein